MEQNKSANNRGKGKKKMSKSALKQHKMKTKSSPQVSDTPAFTEDVKPVDDSIKVNVKDIHIPNFTMARPGGGKELLSETDIKLINGRKYGLIGRNGFGKTTLLSHIASGKIPEIPSHLRILHIKQEMPATEKTVLETVLSFDQERQRLMAKEQELTDSLKTLSLSDKQNDAMSSQLNVVYDRLRFIDASTAQERASIILNGLQFTEDMRNEPTKSLSGGWRMRVSLACALFSSPDLLLLDEPTNHLDFPAVKWLTDYLNNYENTLAVVSHDRKFLNDVCTDIMHIENMKLKYYRGNYDTFERVRKEQRKQAKTAFDKQQATIEHNQDFIRRFRANKKLASLAQSRIKIIAGMEKLEDVKEDSKFRFRFPDPDPLKKDEFLLFDEMAFGYSGNNPSRFLYRDVNLRLSRGGVIGVFGKNGTGKSTLISLVMGELQQVSGRVELNGSLVVGYFAQHHSEMLDLELTPYELLNKMFPKTKHQDIYRKLGQFNLAANCANQKIGLLSGGEKSRLSFAILTWHKPHLLIMDEPTNVK